MTFIILLIAHAPIKLHHFVCQVWCAMAGGRLAAGAGTCEEAGTDLKQKLAEPYFLS